MPISSNRYVNITSAVGGGSAVPTKELLLRLYTANERIPTGSVLNYSASTLATSLKDFFGSNSDEYKQAAYYFGLISKLSTSPNNIQFARWADIETAAQVFGSEASTLDVLKTYDDSSFDIVLAGVTANITALDLSAATTYADVATALETIIKAAGGGLTGVTVTFDATRTSFDFDTGGAADGSISFIAVEAGLLDDLGWGENAAFSDGVVAQTVTDVLSDSTSVNNNYGSFDFIYEAGLSDEQIEERAIFANVRNIEFMNFQRVLKTNRATIEGLIGGYASTGMVLSPLVEEYPNLLPAAILASLNYDKPGASTNFMYYEDTRLTPSVTTDQEADINDALSVNYYGQTQEAGNNISFFQRGRLTGGSTALKAMGVHANDQWFKAHLKSQFISMFLASQEVPADEAGQAMGLTYLDAGVAKALRNGSIAIGKTLTVTEINYITQITGDNKAYLDVESLGYWYTLDVNATTNEMTYLLVYAKRDSIDKVEGRHSLI